MGNDWSANLADRLNLALCLEDAQLAQRVAPRQPLRRLYRRLCHHPGLWFLPPGCDTLLLLAPMFFFQELLELGSVMNWLMFLCLWLIMSAMLGLLLNRLLWPVHLAFWKGLEGCCWLIDALTFDRFIRLRDIHGKQTGQP